MFYFIEEEIIIDIFYSKLNLFVILFKLLEIIPLFNIIYLLF